MTETYLIPLLLQLAQDPQPQNQPGPAERGTQQPGAPGTQAPAGGTPGQQPQPPCGTDMLLMVPLILLLMYFMVFRPEQRRRKDAQRMMSELKAGDRIVTIGGMHAEVDKVEEHTIVLRVDTLRMKIDKTAIARVVRDEPPRPAGR